MLARRKHPGVSNKLDDLCTRYKIDNSRRTKHGALLDAELLAEVYIELVGARQTSLSLVTLSGRQVSSTGPQDGQRRERPQPLASRVTDETRAAHLAFVATLGDDAVWKKYL
jgi:DNA polymerase-3 subunit epsilon